MLGENTGHAPGDATVFRTFADEYERLQRERLAACSEFVADVHGGAYPEPGHLVGVAPEELARLREELAALQA